MASPTYDRAVQITITGRTMRRLLLGLLVGVALAGLAWASYLLIRPDNPFGGEVDASRFQAVFLVNDQVYFGRLEQGEGRFYVLREAFFLQDVPGEQGRPPTKQVRSVAEEFHQPSPDILIPREAVVRVDNLPPRSQVAAAIQRVMTAREVRPPPG